MKRNVFICFFIVLISIVVLNGIRENKVKASVFDVALESGESDMSENAVEENREENSMTGKSNLKKTKAYSELLEKLSKSNYKIVKGKVLRESEKINSSSIEEKEIKIINNALEAIKGKILIPEDAKVFVQSEDTCYVVIFENKLPEGVRGGDYSARVTIDSKSGEILEILGSD